MPEDVKPGAYRPDIDGLRAFAILPVVLFHAKLAGITGGYVGVDVFFVISGFLITGILRRDPSIRRFYARRVRRIIPALLTVILCALAAGLALMLASDLRSLSTSVLSAIAFVSNVWAWREAGYFGGPAEVKPLLHTWSLAVEEQFYVFFPLVMIWVRSWRKGPLLLLLAAFASLSFLAAVFVMRHDKATLAFYLSPFRVWELLIGSMLAIAEIRVADVRVRSALAIAGLGTVLATIFLYTPATPFPGVAALAPVLGTAAVLVAGRDGRHAISGLLEWRPLVFVGLISYSLYLWHWPIFAFLRLLWIEPPPIWAVLVATAASLLAAWLSYRFVERPTRHLYGGMRMWAVYLGATALIVAVAGAALIGKGWPSRMPPQVATLDGSAEDIFMCPLSASVPFGGSRACDPLGGHVKPAQADLLIWGDSHAEMYARAIAAAYPNLKVNLILARGCAPTADVNATPSCLAAQRKNLAAIKQLRPKVLVIAFNWVSYRDQPLYFYPSGGTKGDKLEAITASVERTVRDLQRPGLSIVVFGPIPRPGFEVAHVLAREIVYRGGERHPTGVNRQAFEASMANALAGLRQLQQSGAATVVLPHELICGPETCPYVVAGRSIYADYGHLSQTYVHELGPRLACALNPKGRSDCTPSIGPSAQSAP